MSFNELSVTLTKNLPIDIKIFGWYFKIVNRIVKIFWVSYTFLQMYLNLHLISLGKNVSSLHNF